MKMGADYLEINDLDPFATVRAPAKSGHEACLSLANAAARVRSAARLNISFADLGLPEVAQHADCVAAKAARVGLVRPFEPLLYETFVDAEVSRSLNTRSGALVFGRQERQLAGSFVTSTGSLAASLADGWTLRCSNPWHPSLDSALLDLERIFGARCTQSLYVSIGTAAGPAPEPFDEDRIQVQLVGRRNLVISHPMQISHHSTNPGKVDHQVAGLIEMCPGDQLFLPRGWTASLSPVDEMAAHIEILIRRQLVLDIAERVAGDWVRHPHLRANVPGDLSATIDSYQGDIWTDPDLLARESGGFLDRARIVGHVALWRACLPARATGPLSLMESGPCELENQVPGGFWILQRDSTKSATTVVASGRTLTLPTDHLPAFADLVDGTSTRRSTDPLAEAAVSLGWLGPGADQ